MLFLLVEKNIENRNVFARSCNSKKNNENTKMSPDELLIDIQEKLETKKKNRDRRKENGDYFNIFELCGIAGKENIYSNVIANLLDPGWNHGQGNIFLKKFFDRLGIEFENAGNTTVAREEVIPGRRPDIVIRNGENLIVIENKTGTCDHENQLQDYWNWMSNKEGNKTLIYLTKYGEHPRCEFKIPNVYPDSNDKKLDNVSSCTALGDGKRKFILLPYSEIRDWCACCAIIPGIPVHVSDAFKQYANFIELWLNNETDGDDIIELCAKDKNLDAAHTIYLNDAADDASRWVKDNYDQIIKAYIASQFPGKIWDRYFLKLKEIDETIFNVGVELNTTKRGRKFILIGITQSETIEYKSEYDLPLKQFFEDFNVKNSGDNCWWIVHQEIKNIKDCTTIKDELYKEIRAVKDLLNRTDLQKIFKQITVCEKNGTK